jgi:hypothetical protein
MPKMMMKQRMQEQLDGVLEKEQEAELYAYLARDEEAAQEYARLEQVATLFSRASHVRAPQRLAVTIMARLSQQLQREADMEEMPEEVKQAFLLCMSLVTLETMPMMVAASYLVLNVGHDPKLIGRVLEQTIALQVMVIDALVFLLKEVEYQLSRDPEKAAVTMSLIPIVLENILDYLHHPNGNNLQ